MGKLILAIDQGTTGTTALLVDGDLHIRDRVNVEFPQHFPQPGRVEHDPEEIWTSVRAAVTGLLERADCRATDIAAIGITNQRETVLIWERESGRPCGNAIVWQDRRTADICDELKARGLEPLFRQRTGLVFDPYFSGTKLTWMLRQSPELAERAADGSLACGTIDSFLVWRLTGGRAHVTDVSNASRTLLLNLESLDWDMELADRLGIPLALLPEVRPSSQVYGTTCGLDFLPDGIPVAGMAGDQQAALFGQACFEPGDGKCTYGTGAFLLVNTGDRPVTSGSGLLTTVAWQIDGQTCYALEGSAFIAGAAVQWLRDGLGLIESSADIEALARQVPDSGGVVFVPALTGLGAPHWRPEARGGIFGLTRGTTRAHLARATLDGIALQIYELAAAMAEDLGEPLGEFRVDGGAAANDLLMQLQADLLRTDVVRPETIETTALGAALLAGLATGVWQGTEQIRQAWREERRFRPQMEDADRQRMLAGWRRAVGRV
ncbi:glycerol kinase [Geothermobacter ehrlichii]|uniref:Glycerol kinase n=1 Tax=Geothermobacter ehrlichii TaxID=213224 RepID=A0A5D3WH18_9BACT|nr:glycerol kinase GlpK [Geothermobacter ehrlichii]TYO96376.1 glycerol kinase [Geothermobacter ehrlichii]